VGSLYARSHCAARSESGGGSGGWVVWVPATIPRAHLAAAGAASGGGVGRRLSRRVAQEALVHSRGVAFCRLACAGYHSCVKGGEGEGGSHVWSRVVTVSALGESTRVSGGWRGRGADECDRPI
jgi:hypothetical protein